MQLGVTRTAVLANESSEALLGSVYGKKSCHLIVTTSTDKERVSRACRVKSSSNALGSTAGWTIMKIYVGIGRRYCVHAIRAQPEKFTPQNSSNGLNLKAIVTCVNDMLLFGVITVLSRLYDPSMNVQHRTPVSGVSKTKI